MPTTYPWPLGLCLVLAGCALGPSAAPTVTVQPSAAMPAASPPPSASVEESTRSENEANEGPEFEELTRETERKWCAALQKERCDAMRAFRRADVPTVAANASFTVGSEAGTIHPAEFVVLRFSASAQPGTGVQVAVTVLKPDNAGEVADTERYVASIARGRRDMSSPLSGFLQTPRAAVPPPPRANVT